jgi:uncharacterized protein
MPGERATFRGRRALVGDYAMSQAAKIQEPSMEEILSSIRRIIAEDDGAKASDKPNDAPAPAAKPPQASSQAPRAPVVGRAAASQAAANSQHRIDAILAELDGPLKAVSKAVPVEPAEPEEPDDDIEEPAPANFRTIDPASDVVFAERPADPPAEPYAAYEAPRQPEQSPGTLISTATLTAVDSAFNSLAHTVIGQNARTLEDLVKEMLRPLLKVWLDDNLPGLVERIVRAEIERVSRGRR